MPANLISISAVDVYLSNTPFASHTITLLTGGSANYAYRIHLFTPFEGQQTLVLKHAQPYVKDLTNIPFGLERQTFEVEAMTRIKAWLPSDSIVTVPKIYLSDKENSVVIMEDCGDDIITLKDFLWKGRAEAPGLAETIGSCLGEFLASMHNWSKENPDGILDFFEGNQQAKKMSAWAVYGRLVSTLTQEEEVLPALSDPPIAVSEPDMEVVVDIASDTTLAMISTRDVFVMGDFWPGNIMVVMNNEQNIHRLYILDWELAKPGLPGVELGQFCAEMHLLQCFHTIAKDPASKILRSFLEAYARISKPDRCIARDALAHWGGHLVVWTPRIPWGDKPTTRVVVKEGIELLVSSRQEDALKQSPVSILFTDS